MAAMPLTPRDLTAGASDLAGDSEARFRATFEGAPVGMAHVGLGGEWLAVNPRLCEILGYSREELLARRFQDLTYRDDLAPDLDQALRLLAGELPSYSLAKRYVRKDGSVVWVRLIGSLVRDAGGNPLHFLAVVDEITGPELAQLKAVAAEKERERLTLALEGAEDGVWDWNVPSGVVNFSERISRMLGYTPAELAPHVQSWESLIHPDDRAAVMRVLDDHLEGRTERYETEHRLRRRDGTWAWILDRGKVVTRDAEGRPIRMVGTHKDITVQRETLEALAESHALARRQLAELEAVYRSAPVALVFVDADLRCVRVNARMAAMHGVSPEAHVGHTLSGLGPNAGPYIEDVLRRVLTTGAPVHQVEFRAETAAEPGIVRDWVLSCDPVVDTTGAAIGVTGAIAEVSALKRVEAERDALLQREASARADAEAARAHAEDASQAKSTFLAMMSHEFRTPLNAIGGHTQLLEMELYGPITPAQQDALARITLAQRHLLRLVEDILTLSRLQSPSLTYDLGRVSLAEVVGTLDSLTAPQAREKRLTLATHVPPECVVLADREKLVQVLVNLVSNAVKFTPPGGTVTIEVATDRASEESPMVKLRVSDTGPGIPADQLERIFDPFVQVDTTPARRAMGTGLGLAISRDLARGMGGDLRVESTPGAGSTFTISLRRGD